MQLAEPSHRYLPGYIHALERGFSPDNSRGTAATSDELAAIRDDPVQFLRNLDSRDGNASPIALPDGSLVARLPGFIRWMWDGKFAGTIGFRWRPGAPDLPEHCLGHIGYAVVGWRQRRGYATAAVAEILPEARKVGLTYVEITTDASNLASQKVIERAGGKLFEHFTKPAQFGSGPALRYRIDVV